MLSGTNRLGAELRPAVRVNAIADGNIEVVVIDASGDMPFAFELNYSEFPNSCRGNELAVVVKGCPVKSGSAVLESRLVHATEGFAGISQMPTPLIPPR